MRDWGKYLSSIALEGTKTSKRGFSSNGGMIKLSTLRTIIYV